MNGANQYKQTSIKTASRGQILIMLYEGAIRNVRKASDCIDKKDLAGKGMAIGKAHDIISELQATLDFSVGGDIARNLENLYIFMLEQLIKANVSNTKEPLQTVEKLLRNLLDAWRVAVDQFNRNPSAAMEGTAPNAETTPSAGNGTPARTPGTGGGTGR
jgi:flagellar protein FliS